MRANVPTMEQVAQKEKKASAPAARVGAADDGRDDELVLNRDLYTLEQQQVLERNNRVSQKDAMMATLLSEAAKQSAHYKRSIFLH